MSQGPGADGTTPDGTTADGTRARQLRFEVDGATLVGWESGAGPAVVLLHAGGERSDVWEPVAERLVARHGVRCVAVDQRAHGRSSGRAERLEDFGDDVAAVLATESAPCVVVGASLGGFAAIDALRHAGARRVMAGIVLVDVVPDPEPVRVRRFLAERGMEVAHQALRDDILAASPRLRRLVAGAQVPVMMVRATESAISAEEIARLASAVTDFEVVDVEAGHLVARDAPQELADAIGKAVSRWLTGAPPRPEGRRAEPEDSGSS